jgi:hypothetical protein
VQRFCLVYLQASDNPTSYEVVGSVDDEGTSTVWDEQFDTDRAALEEVLNAIEEEGIAAFRENANVIPFPKK